MSEFDVFRLGTKDFIVNQHGSPVVSVPIINVRIGDDLANEVSDFPTNSDAIPISNASVMVQRDIDFSPKSSGVISAITDGGGGKSQIFSLNHGLRTGDVIVAKGVGAYEGRYDIEKIDNDFFYITKTFSGSATGTWYKGFSVDFIYDGVYHCRFDGTIYDNTPLNTPIFFFFSVNNIGLLKTENVVFMFNNAHSMPVYTLLDVKKGDRLRIDYMNPVDTSEIEVSGILNIFKLRTSL